MGQHSKIEWTDATWPVVKGCDYVSPGCANCYAADLIHRHSNHPNPKISLPLAGLTEVRNGRPRWTGKVYLNEPHLADPLKWKKPQRIFVPSHGDLFHADVPDEFIDRVFAVMGMAGRHTFQVLTKRPDRLAAYLEQVSDERDMQRWANAAAEIITDSSAAGVFDGLAWPLRNVWLGFSAENQEWFDRRAVQMARLMRTGWTVFVSAEPLLGPIRVSGWDGTVQRNWLTGPDGPGVSWVIVGGESGSDARWCRVEWVRDLVAQCRAASVPVFVKQLGARVTSELPDGERWPGGDGLPSGRLTFTGDGFGNYLVRGLRDTKGGDPAEWPSDLRVREFPEPKGRAS